MTVKVKLTIAALQTITMNKTDIALQLVGVLHMHRAKLRIPHLLMLVGAFYIHVCKYQGEPRRGT